jgi:hypothetical protein
MRDRYGYEQPERRASTGLPISILLLSMLAITIYLLVGGAFSNNGRRDVAVYVPQAAGTNATTPREAVNK